MATEGYWAEPPLERHKTFSYWPLDAMISQDDPVRLVDEVLSGMDWSPWEAYYERKQGQPPIHPKHIAAVILYGMYRGIRSTRKLEEACNYRLDFKWLVEGRRIDHSTISKFRVRYREPLKDLFKQIGRIAITMGLVRFAEVGFDGTRVKSFNSRFNTRTAKTLEEKLQVLDELFEYLLKETNATDESQTEMGSTTKLPKPLADVERRREKIREALEQAREADEARRKQGTNPEKNPAQVPMADPDSRVMPNKEGGYAPNYTPVATTDGQCGFILDVDVLDEVNESGAAVPSVDRIEETFGERPEKFLTDAGNTDGSVQHEMEQRGVEFYAPVRSSQPQPDNPALRDDPTQPVPESEWPKLPRNSNGKLDKSCFTYNAEQDQYDCPQGQPMPFECTKPEQRGNTRVIKRVYRSSACAGCPLAAACLDPKNKHGRTITRDQFEEVRERTAARMATESARKIYNQRPRIAETAFAYLKSVMGIRQFFLRGLEKVKTEWRWAATAFNLGKLVRHIARLRAEFSELAAEG